jgi:hypothetical protein
MWRPLGVDYKNGQYNIIDNLEKTKRQLWLWIHPAAFMEAAKSIANACQSIMSENDRIEIHDRRGAMSRFRLRGRLADAILSSICKAPSSSSQFQEEMGENDSDHNDGFLKHEIANITTTRNVQSVENVIQSQKKDHQTAKIFSVSVKDPRTYQKSGFIEDCDDSRLSLLTEPSQDKLNESNGDIKCPITGESLLDPKVKVNENELEPSLEEISKSIEAVLSWARTPGMSLMNIHANAPTVDKQEKAKICDTSPVPCSLLWSHNQRTKLSQSFEKDNILNERVFRRRKEIKVRKGFVDHEIKDASPLEEPLHLLLVKVNNTFPHTSGWDLILLPEYSPSLLKTISFAGALVVSSNL